MEDGYAPVQSAVELDVQGHSEGHGHNLSRGYEQQVSHRMQYYFGGTVSSLNPELPGFSFARRGNAWSGWFRCQPP